MLCASPGGQVVGWACGRLGQWAVGLRNDGCQAPHAGLALPPFLLVASPVEPPSAHPCISAAAVLHKMLQAFFEKGEAKSSGMRRDTLAILLSHANIGAGSRVSSEWCARWASGQLGPPPTTNLCTCPGYVQGVGCSWCVTTPCR
jgi:hypothetical protein